MIILWITSIDMWKTLQTVHGLMMIFLFSFSLIQSAETGRGNWVEAHITSPKNLLSHPAQQARPPNIPLFQSSSKWFPQWPYMPAY